MWKTGFGRGRWTQLTTEGVHRRRAMKQIQLVSGHKKELITMFLTEECLCVINPTGQWSPSHNMKWNISGLLPLIGFSSVTPTSMCSSWWQHSQVAARLYRPNTYKVAEILDHWMTALSETRTTLFHCCKMDDEMIAARRSQKDTNES